MARPVELKRDQYGGGLPGLPVSVMPRDVSVTADAVKGVVYLHAYGSSLCLTEAEARGVSNALVAAWSRLDGGA
jgi:hypothetical protein